jgi:hypothetical protein
MARRQKSEAQLHMEKTARAIADRIRATMTDEELATLKKMLKNMGRERA